MLHYYYVYYILHSDWFSNPPCTSAIPSNWHRKVLSQTSRMKRYKARDGSNIRHFFLHAKSKLSLANCAFTIRDLYPGIFFFYPRANCNSFNSLIQVARDDWIFFFFFFSLVGRIDTYREQALFLFYTSEDWSETRGGFCSQVCNTARLLTPGLYTFTHAHIRGHNLSRVRCFYYA